MTISGVHGRRLSLHLPAVAAVAEDPRMGSAAHALSKKQQQKQQKKKNQQSMFGLFRSRRNDYLQDVTLRTTRMTTTMVATTTTPGTHSQSCT